MWIERVFPDPEDPYDRIWHGKLSFQDVPNGDQLTLDLGGGSDPSVVYLSHEGDVSLGMRLGRDFIDFVDRWSLLGCVGPEDWQLENFVAPTGGLDPDSENGRLWRRWFGLES